MKNRLFYAIIFSVFLLINKEIDIDIKNKSEEVLEVEEKFLSATGCRVEIKGKLTKGKVVIPYENAEELENIGLAVPEITYVMKALKAAGYHIVEV